MQKKLFGIKKRGDDALLSLKRKWKNNYRNQRYSAVGL
jgi:hypothetical protein